SLAVKDGRVFANVSANGSPYAAALDQNTGKILWKTVVAKGGDAYTNSSVALIDGMLFIGISGPEDVGAKVRHPGGFALLDPANGKIITRVYTIKKHENDQGLKGASFWGTPVYDPKTGYMFDGTGQPANKAKESSLSNALVKVDVNRKHSSFAKIVDYYHGDYDEGADLDFGGSPTMFKDKKGNLIIGALQKSGRYHAVYADDMEQAWWARLGDPLALGNAGTGATDGKAVYVAASGQTDVEAREPNPGYLYSLSTTNGAVNWKTPIASGVDYHLISTAGGIVYVVTTHGLLLGLNAQDGLPVVARSLSVDAHEPCVNLSSGAIVARHTIYAVCDVAANGLGYVVAYGQ
ncbi:MAG: hypothetical protein QOH90_2192, partial [Actinomycetota bacterium]|nr:hypothetical protein [Actinomycetota bacterium]